MDWVLLRFKSLSFLPGCDVRRIPHVRVGGLSIRITESLSSSNAKNNGKDVGSSSADRGGSGGGGGDGAKRRPEMEKFGSSDWLAGREQQNPQEEGMTAVAAAAVGVAAVGRVGGSERRGDGFRTWAKRARQASASSQQQQQGQGQQSPTLDRQGSWTHRGRRASAPNTSLDGATGGGLSVGDGCEMERVAQATLEHALGPEFSAKYHVRETGRRKKVVLPLSPNCGSTLCASTIMSWRCSTRMWSAFSCCGSCWWRRTQERFVTARAPAIQCTQSNGGSRNLVCPGIIALLAIFTLRETDYSTKVGSSSIPAALVGEDLRQRSPIDCWGDDGHHGGGGWPGL